MDCATRERRTFRRMFGILAAFALVLALCVVAAPSSAHQTTEFTACTVHTPGHCIKMGAAFLYGDTVLFKGSVKPDHAGSVVSVVRREPCFHPNGHACPDGAPPGGWHKVGTVQVSDRNRIRFSWKTRFRDVVQNAPYYFKFKILNHGSSNVTEAYVTTGE